MSVPVTLTDIHYSVCRVQLTDAGDLVATTVLSTFIESCVWSIAETDTQTVEWTIQTFNSSAEIVTIFSVNITLILNEVLAISCPGQPICGGHGSCISALCVCDTGYFLTLCL